MAVRLRAVAGSRQSFIRSSSGKLAASSRTGCSVIEVEKTYKRDRGWDGEGRGEGPAWQGGWGGPEPAAVDEQGLFCIQRR